MTFYENLNKVFPHSIFTVYVYIYTGTIISGHKIKKYISKYKIKILKTYLGVLDDGSPTSTNLGNDHGFISEEC